MLVELTTEQEALLTQIADAQGRKAESLVREAVERMIGYEDWFLAEVKRGLAAVDQGALIDHEDVRRMIEQRFANK